MQSAVPNLRGQAGHTAMWWANRQSPRRQRAGATAAFGGVGVTVSKRFFLLGMAALSGLVAVLVRQAECYALFCGLILALAGAWRVR